MSIEYVTCPCCSILVPFDVDALDIQLGEIETEHKTCQRCGSTFDVDIVLNLEISEPRLLSAPNGSKWNEVACYYFGRTIEHRVGEWAVSNKAISLECVMRDPLARSEFNGVWYVTDGYLAMRSPGETGEIENQTMHLSTFLSKVSRSVEIPAMIVARVFGVVQRGGGIEDYAVFDAGIGSLIFLHASRVDAALQACPSLRMSAQNDGDFIVMSDDSGIFAIVAAVAVDSDYEEKVCEFVRGAGVEA